MSVQELTDALLSADRVRVRRLLTDSSLELSVANRVEDWVTPALERIGRDWETGRASLSQVYLAGRLCEELVDSLLPAGSANGLSQPTIAVAVLEDYHLLGKRLVHATLRSAGLTVADYGRVTVDALVERVATDGVEVLLISTLMLPSALRVAAVRAGLDRLGVRPRVIVGGAPFRYAAGLWRDVGADATGTNAADAVALALRQPELTR